MKVKEIMSPGPLKVPSDTSLNEIGRIFARARIWSILIVDQENLVGVVTKNDLKFRSIGKSPKTPVSKIMSTGVYQIDANADVQEAISLLDKMGINGVAVTENKRLCGIVTRYDIRTRYYPRLEAGIYSEETEQNNNVVFGKEKGEKIFAELGKSEVNIMNDSGKNNSKLIREKTSFSGRITGRTDAVNFKNKYQKELDNTWDGIVTFIHKLEELNRQLKYLYAKIPAAKKNIDAHEEEKDELFTSLHNLLKKETDFEERMWKTTQKNRNIRSINIKQKFTESDVEQITNDSMLDYLKQYPEYASKSSFKQNLEKINEKEKEIRIEKEKYGELVSDYNSMLNTFETLIKKAEDKFDAYYKIKKEGETRLVNLRYNKSALNALRTETDKEEVKLDLLNHRPDQFKNTLEIIKSEFANAQRKSFVEMPYE